MVDDYYQCSTTFLSIICTTVQYRAVILQRLYGTPLSLSLRAAPCLSGGSCTNTDDSFSCNCTPGTTGQGVSTPPSVTLNPAQSTSCVSPRTVANAQVFVCGEQTSDGVVVTLGNTNTGMLDDQVNSLREIQQVRYNVWLFHWLTLSVHNS